MSGRGILRRLGWVASLLALVVMVLIAAAASLWWWTGTQASLDWAWQRYAQPLGLQGEQVTGSLRGGVRAQRLQWSQGGLSAQVQGADIGWQPLELLLQRRLRLTHLRAAAVAVEDRRPATVSQPPLSLALPLEVTADDILVGQLRWQGATIFEATDLSAQYRYAGGEHHLGLRNARVAGGRYEGQVRLGDAAPLALHARLQGAVQAPVPGRAAPLTLALDASAQGSLPDISLQAQLRTVDAAPAASAPTADLTARVMPWGQPLLAQAQARLRSIDLATLWPQAPRTDLHGNIDFAPGAAGTWRLAADLANRRPGPWDRGQLPLSRLQGHGEWRDGTALVREFVADLGGGRVEGRGEWLEGNAWQAQAQLRGVRPGQLHTALAAVPVSGQLQAQGRGQAVSFSADLQAQGQGAPADDVALALRQLQASGRLDAGRLSLASFMARTDDARLEGALDLDLPTRAGRGRATLAAPGLRATAEGTLAPTTGQGTLTLDVGRLAQARQWLERLPGLGTLPLADLSPADGDARLALQWQGGWRSPKVQAQLAGQVRQDQRQLRLDLAAQAAGDTLQAWSGRIDTLQATLREPRLGSGDWRLQLQSPLAWRFAQGRLDTGSGQASLTAPVRSGPSQARLAWDPIRVGQGELQSTGRLSGLPMAWLALVGQVPPSGDLVFDGQWDARLGQALRLRASLARASGDLSVLAESGEGKSTRVTAGVREARIALDSDGDALTAVVRWDSERAGTLDGRLATRLSRGAAGWQWPEDAPLSGRLQARLPRLAVWSLLAPPGWRLRGSLDADLSVAGTRGQPSLQGPVRADDLGLRSVVDGVALENGRLRARLDTRRLVIDELVLQGAAGGGQLRAEGEVAWVGGDAGLQARLTAQLAQLRASVRADRQITVSGAATATLDKQAVALTGDLTVDRARIVLPDEAAPQLGDDVVVRNLPPGVTLRPEADRAASGGRALRLAVRVALGDDVRIQGRGLTARLRGALDVSGTSMAEPRLTGTVETVEGDYLAYGQRLDIERGVLRFTGAADNPALDVLAVRTNPQQRVGVQITGRAQSPVVRLYADPDLPDAEKLSWLVLGRASAAGGAEAALVQQAAVSLLTQRSGGGGKGIAGWLGLDELSVRRDSAEGAAITLGKRFANNFYAAYDRSLAGALGTLRVFYDLTARLTVRAEAGDRSGVDLIYTLSYD